MNKRWIVILNCLSVAILGALGAQILHEACHGIAAVLVGAEWQAFNLFAVLWGWHGTPNETGALIVEASAALLNILTGFLSVWLFGLSLRKQQAMSALLWMYYGAYSLFMGFGYLLTDPLFYQAGGEQVGDWKKVIDMLGGSWVVRAPLFLIGAVGVLWVFFWLARAALRFTADATDKAERRRVALPLLLIPYLTINALFTLLAFWHPLGADGVFIVVFHYWFGYIGFFWAFFLAAYWLDIHAPLPNSVAMPDTPQPFWWMVAATALLLAVIMLLPTLWLMPV